MKEFLTKHRIRKATGTTKDFDDDDDPIDDYEDVLRYHEKEAPKVPLQSMADLEAEAEQGDAKVKEATEPNLPSAEEIKKHNLTHLPYRNWCSHCVMGRGKEDPHHRVKTDNSNDDDEVEGKPVIQLDYMQLKSKTGGE